MSRISTYPIDNNITGDDKVIGSNSEGFVTKNYTFNGIVNWFNGTGAVAINEQSNYFFQSIAAVTGRLPGTISFNNFGGVGTSFSAISLFKISEQSLAGYTLEDYLPVLIGNKIVLAQLDDLNNFGIYQVANISRDLIETTFFNVLVVYQNGHGALELDKFYGISLHAVSDTTVPNLEAVLSAGNTSLLDANIGQLGIYDTGNDAYAKIYSTDKNFQFKNTDDNLIFSLEPGFFVTYKSADIAGSISTRYLTDTRNLEFPDNSGTIALTSDIPDTITLTTVGTSGAATLIGNTLNIPVYSGGSGTVPTLDEVLDEGNTSELNASIGELGLYDSFNSQYYKIVANDELFKFKNNLGSNIFIVGYSEFSLFNGTGAIAANFSSALLTSTRNFQFPNASGTIALTSDIPSLLGYVPYIGAVSSVNLGEYELKAGQLSLDTSPTGTLSVGTTQWNDTIGSSQTLLKGGTVILKNGVDLVARIVNKVTPNATLLRANYQAVRISGAQGQRLAVAYAQANNDNNSADTIGLVCENISTNQEGFIITVGQLEEINTTGSLQGETWSDGDVLYLSPTTPGKLTNIKPTGATGHIVVMGYVEYSHAIHGKIYVKIMNGWELDELHNVYITSPANNNVLAYTSSTQLWEDKTINTVLGFTPENVANKSTNLPADISSDTKYPTTKAVGDYALAKAFERYSFKANNTATTNAPAQDFWFQQTGKQTYTGTVTWSGTTAPSGTTNFTFNWIRIGNMVTLNITLHYSVPGTANTGAVVPLLSSMPTPVPPDGLGASSRYIYPAYGKMSLNDTSITTAASEVAMRINTGFDGYELVITQSSTSAKVLKITCQYFTA